MEEVKQILNALHLIFEGVIAIGGLYWLFFKSYLSEKGKNVATKEDIEEITKKVETIKYKSNIQSKLYDETKEATIRAYEVLNQLTKAVEQYGTPSRLLDNEQQVRDLYEELIAIGSKVELYLGKHEIVNKFQNLSGRLYQEFYSSRFRAEMLQTITEGRREIDKQLEETTDEAKRAELKQMRRENVDHYNNVYNRPFFGHNFERPRHELQEELRQLIYQYLTQGASVFS